MPEWIGKTIGKVRIDKLLARGGMAEVYLGTHLTLERPVAIKLLHSYIEEEPFLLERFHREAKVVANLRHPNIVQIYDFDTTDGHPYIVMEYLRGPTLATYLRHLHQRKKRLPSDQVAGLLKGLTDALDYAHRQGVIHRDIKPGNIMLHKKAEDIPLDRPLTNDVDAILTDFGLVRVVNTASQTASGFLSGTPAYMSPEQARGDQIDQRTDIYSLGVVLYEMLAGRVPFEADNTVTILHMHIHTSPPPIPGISAKVQAVLDRALSKNADDRYQTSQGLVNEFYLAIGMPLQVDMVREPYPLKPVPTEIPPPTKPEFLPTSQSSAEPEPPPPSQPGIELEPPESPRFEPEPLSKSESRLEPEPSPEPQPVVELEPSPKSEPRMEPELPKPLPRILAEPPSKSEPQPESVPLPKSQPRIEPEPPAKPQPRGQTEPAPKPTGGRRWIGLGLIGLVGLSILAFGARFLLPIVLPPRSTGTLSPVGTNTAAGPLPSATSSLPPADRMVEITAGTYEVGTTSPADEFHVAPTSLQLDGFWIDQYQTTNAEYEKYLAETSVPQPIVWPGEPDHPVRGLTWDQAVAYCTWANKRLPTEAEWEAAGRGPGPDARPYPWGADPTADGQARSLPDQDTYAVGTLAFNKSPAGVFDMVGNVWEWVGEPYAPTQDAYKIMRGGRYGLLWDLSYRLAVAADDTRYLKYAGFRCAADQVQ